MSAAAQPRHAPRVTIVPLDDGQWWASLQDGTGSHVDEVGTRDEVIAWAWEQPVAERLIFEPDGYVPLEARS